MTGGSAASPTTHTPGPTTLLAMSTASDGHDQRPPIGPQASPREIRAGLLPEEAPAFDRAWRAALTEAADTLDMTRVFDTLNH